MEASPFVTLAPELRNRIYDLALSEYEAIIIDKDYRKDGIYVVYPKQSMSLFLRGLALTYTCKQLREECTRLFYACNKFVVDDGLSILDKFVAMIGEQNAKALGSVELRYLGTVDFEWDNGGPDDCIKCANKLAALRRRTKQQGWSEVRATVKIFGRGSFRILGFDVVDLGEPWDELEASLRHGVQGLNEGDTRTIREAMREWREMLKTI